MAFPKSNCGCMFYFHIWKCARSASSEWWFIFNMQFWWCNCMYAKINTNPHMQNAVAGAWFTSIISIWFALNCVLSIICSAAGSTKVQVHQNRCLCTCTCTFFYVHGFGADFWKSTRQVHVLYFFWKVQKSTCTCFVLVLEKYMYYKDYYLITQLNSSVLISFRNAIDSSNFMMHHFLCYVIVFFVLSFLACLRGKLFVVCWRCFKYFEFWSMNVHYYLLFDNTDLQSKIK